MLELKISPSHLMQKTLEDGASYEDRVLDFASNVLQFAAEFVELKSELEEKYSASVFSNTSLVELVNSVSTALKKVESMQVSEEMFQIPKAIKDLYSFQEKIASLGSEVSEGKSDAGNVEELVDARNRAVGCLVSGDLFQIVQRKELELISFEERMKEAQSQLEDCNSKVATILLGSDAFLGYSQESRTEDAINHSLHPSEVLGVIEAMRTACAFYFGPDSLYRYCSSLNLTNLREFASARPNLNLNVSKRKESFIALESKAIFLNEKLSSALIQVSALLSEYEIKLQKARAAFEERSKPRFTSFKNIVSSSGFLAQSIQNQLSEVQAVR
jgi:hypothetical protein